MGKLTNLKPTLPTLRPSVAFMPEGRTETDRFRNTQHWRKWYNTKRWRELRWSVLVRDGFTCQMPDCGKVMPPRLLVANHREAHAGREALFWDELNLETVCKPCHDSKVQAAEAKRRARGEFIG